MEPLDLFAPDLLSIICSFLDYTDLIRLRCASPRFRLLLEEGLAKDIAVTRGDPKLATLPLIGSSLRKLLIHDLQYFKNTHLQPINPGYKLVEWLPRTLEEIDLAFQSAVSIWVQPDPLNLIHWSLKSPISGFAPVFLENILPNLKSLKLRGDWFSSINADYSDPNAFRPFGSSPSKPRSDRQIMWTRPMRALFIKKLPSCLTTLEIPFEHTTDLWTYLPPHLTELVDSARIFAYRRTEGTKPLVDMPQSLYGTLQTFIPGSFHPERLISILSQFQCLHTLCLRSWESSPDLVRHLPPISKLTLRCSTSWKAKDLALLPRSLVTLDIIGVRHPPESDQDSPPVDMLSLLPPNLTSLAITPRQSGKLLASTIFAGFNNCLPNLTELKVTASTLFEIDTLAWVPCERLRILDLSINSPFEEATDDYSALQDYPDSLLDTWPVGKPSRTTSLRLHISNCSSFTDRIASNLPSSLTSLSLWPSTKLTVNGFLPNCPRPLTSLHLQGDVLLQLDLPNDPSSIWSSDDILKLDPRFCQTAPESFSMGPSIPPGLTDLRTGVIAGSRLFGHGATTVTDSALRELVKRPEFAILRSASLEHYDWAAIAAATSSARKTLIHIDISEEFSAESPIWSLENLQSLTVLGLAETKEKPIAALHSSNVRLRTLKIHNWLLGDWFGSDLCKSLTELSTVWNDAFGTMAHMDRLTNLTKLDIHRSNLCTLAGARPNASDGRQYWDLIPRSVAHLSLDFCPQDFEWWSQFLQDNGQHHSGNQNAGIQKPRSLKHYECRLTTCSTDSDFLRLLSPEIISFGGFIRINSRSFLYSNLPRDCTIIDRDTVCKAIFGPQFETFVQLYHSVWYFHDSNVREMDVSAMELSGKDPKCLRSNLIEAVMHLPPTIQTLDRLPFWCPELIPVLPPNLTKLDLTSIETFHFRHDLSELPSTVESLYISISDGLYESPKWFLSKLPRVLKSLAIWGVKLMVPVDLDQLPTGLEKLELPSLDLTADLLPHLPQRALTSLHICAIEPKDLHLLPPNLTFLSAEMDAHESDIKFFCDLNIPLRSCRLSSATNDDPFIYESGSEATSWALTMVDAKSS